MGDDISPLMLQGDATTSCQGAAAREQLNCWSRKGRVSLAPPCSHPLLISASWTVVADRNTHSPQSRRAKAEAVSAQGERMPSVHRELGVRGNSLKAAARMVDPWELVQVHPAGSTLEKPVFQGPELDSEPGNLLQGGAWELEHWGPEPHAGGQRLQPSRQRPL